LIAEKENKFAEGKRRVELDFERESDQPAKMEPHRALGEKKKNPRGGDGKKPYEGDHDQPPGKGGTPRGSPQRLIVEQKSRIPKRHRNGRKGGRVQGGLARVGKRSNTGGGQQFRTPAKERKGAEERERQKIELTPWEAYQLANRRSWSLKKTLICETGRVRPREHVLGQGKKKVAGKKKRR